MAPNGKVSTEKKISEKKVPEKEAAEEKKAETASGIAPIKKDSPILAALAYPLSLIIALLIYLIEKEDKFVRFHALQALIFDLAYSVAYTAIFVVVWVFAVATMGIGALCVLPLILVVFLIFALKLWWAYRAYKGEYFKLPVIGDIAEKHV